MGIDLVVTDLDGTLWETQDHLHPDTVAAVAELDRRGVPLLVATGRRLASTRAGLAGLGLTPPVVVLNGALVVDLATGEHIHRQSFGADAAAKVLDAFLGFGIEPCVYVEHPDVDVFVSDNPSTHPEHLASFGEWVRTGDLAEVVASHEVLAFGVLGLAPSSVEGLEDVLAPIANPHVSDERQFGGGSLTVTVAPPQLSKWDGIEAFCRHRGIDSGNVLAIGDGPNDLEMLDGARVAVVMADAHPAALARADHVVPRAADGGWAQLLTYL
ncbi:HAD family hydrolase [Actinomarinicola tropica]|uniref:HAD-IIB family hydrolase n=1 Tax=Actinomarinicola tropica TaxID=2789776 RepID=A0A5Q2RN45_9ACTN|nr:HAD family hydrolase [Actinomarinicola tropica]QGG96372.1 HAD-IIB family hydrolase [Actinomarinicola tropica]